MFNLTKAIAIVFFLIAIAFLPNSTLADTVKSSTDTAQQAAQEVVKETGVKEQFGKSENGEQLLDNAKNKANKKLGDLANEANSEADLPDSKKLFLKNLKPE